MKKTLLISLLLITNYATAAPEPSFTKGAIFDVYLMTDSKKLTYQENSPAAFFSTDTPPYTMDMYTKNPDTAWIISNAIGYKISGWMKIEESGRHAFSATILSSDTKNVDRKNNYINCHYSLNIEDQNVITLNSNYKDFPQTSINGIDLAPGFYKTIQEWACGYEYDNAHKKSDANYQNHVKYPVVDVKMKAPGSFQAKAFNNLYIRKD